MTLHDMPRFRAALERMCRLHGMAPPTDQSLADWASVLGDYAIEVIEPALDHARQEAGRYHVKAADAEAKARALTRGAQATQGGPTRIVPLFTDADGRTVYQAEYACPLCDDEGWQPVRYDATGQHPQGVLTMGELKALEQQQGGRIPYRRRRCACRRAA